uniref:Major facilitator superfamily (MFS) profile domain-containing protein n=1 Tax=Gasterosteus aculeatus aculeatus TaxID=481459 RepID=A0AAQ4P153_GASAC
MTQVNEIGGMSNGCVHSEVLGDLHPDNVIENISEANDGSRQGEQGDFASDEVTDVDRGWAWVVLGATFLVKALTMALPLCVGVFYTDLQNVLNASNREVSWVPAIMRSLRHAAGPICSLLVKKFGCRATVMLGGVLSGLGLAASFLIHSIKGLYVTAIITGIGFCFSSQPSVNIVQHYFKARLVFANALSSTGMAVGIFTLPLLANYLHTELGWRGSFLVLGGLLLNNCVCGAVMRPPRDPVGRGMPLINLPASLPEEECSTTERLTRLQVWRDVKAFVSEHMAIDQLFQNSRYCAYACGVTWMTLGYGVPMIYLVPYATAGGMEQSKAALVLTCLGGVNAVTRPLFALIFHMPWFKGRYIYAFSWALLINGLSNCICCAGPDFPVLMAYAVIQGVSMSAVGSLMFTILMDLVEMRCFSSALGLFNLMQSVTLLLGPPLAGNVGGENGCGGRAGLTHSRDLQSSVETTKEIDMDLISSPLLL